MACVRAASTPRRARPMSSRGSFSRQFDPDNLTWERVIRIVPAVLFALVLLAVAWKGFYTVKPYQQAVVLRFGKKAATVGPGLHFMIPFVDEALRVSTEENSLR